MSAVPDSLKLEGARFVGRSLRDAAARRGRRGTARGLGAVEGSWRQATDRASALPDGAVDVSVEGEWCFSQTLRHLVFATGAWLSRGIQGAYLPLAEGRRDCCTDR